MCACVLAVFSSVAVEFHISRAIYTLPAGAVNDAVVRCFAPWESELCCLCDRVIDLLFESPENLSVMRAVVQRVSRAEVVIEGSSVACIGEGIVALVAISRQDTEKDLLWMAKKIVELRIFADAAGKMNRSLQDIKGQLLIVSQFTLYGDCRKGRRPSYTDAAPPADAERLYHEFVAIARRIVPDVQTGQFQAMMQVMLTNAGPVTLILDSPGRSGLISGGLLP